MDFLLGLFSGLGFGMILYYTFSTSLRYRYSIRAMRAIEADERWRNSVAAECQQAIEQRRPFNPPPYPNP